MGVMRGMLRIGRFTFGLFWCAGWLEGVQWGVI